MGGVALVLDTTSVNETVDYVERARLRVLQAIRDSLLEAMDGLAEEAVRQMHQAGIHTRTGELEGNILASPTVTEKDGYIRGRVSAERDVTLGGRKSKHIGLWMQEGYHVPAVKLAQMAMNNKYNRAKVFVFTASDGAQVFARGHRAFDVAPHPFMNPAQQSYGPTIIQTVQTAVEEALAE